MNYYNQQEKEIKTIKERTFNVKMSDADMEQFFIKATTAGLTPEELIENFIGDLVYGTYSNGSDETAAANDWFDRCGFEYSSNETLLKYLLEKEKVDDFVGRLSYMEDCKEAKASSEEELNDAENYAWDDEKHWRESLNVEILAKQKEIDYSQEEIDEVWNDFLSNTEDANFDKEAEIIAVLDWHEKLTSEYKAGIIY